MPTDFTLFITTVNIMRGSTLLLLPNGNTATLRLGGDTNGNKVVRLSFGTGRGFSIQTNQNLPLTHQMNNVTIRKDNNSVIAGEEILNHLKRFGTLRQRDITGAALFKE